MPPDLEALRSGQDQEIRGQNRSAILVSAPPPVVLLDLEISGQHREIRGRDPSVVSAPSSRRSAASDLTQAARLSTKLPDPPVFIVANNSHVPFDGLKTRIRDKLIPNGDHSPFKSFKVVYLTSRLSREASKQMSFKRRPKSLSCSELLDILSDFYETSLLVVYKENRHALRY